MPPVSVFISCVSGEFKEHRERLARSLRTIGATVYDQETLQNSGESLSAILAEKIARSDYVLHLIGDTPGRVPERAAVDLFLADHRYCALPTVWSGVAPAPDRYALSYTQWEYWLGVFHQKRHLVYPMFDKEPADPGQRLHMQAVKCRGPLRDRPTSDWHLVALAQGSLINVSGQGAGAQITAPAPEPPVVVLQLTTATGYRAEAALRWRGECVPLGDPVEVKAARHQIADRLAEPFARALDRAGWVLDAERSAPPSPPPVVELVLPHELLSLPPSGWVYSDNGRAVPVRERYAVRLRVAGRGRQESGVVARRLDLLRRNMRRLDRVGLDVPATHRAPECPPFGVVHNVGVGNWWLYDGAVCGAFTQPPPSPRVQKANARQPAGGASAHERAVGHGVPFLVWPERGTAAPDPLADELRAAGDPASLYYHLRAHDYAVLAEDDGPPIPAGPALASAVPTHEGAP